MADELKYSRTLTKILDIVNVITYFALGGVAIGGITIGLLLNNSFSQYDNIASAHVFLVVFGYIIIMSQAMMSLNPVAGWTRAFNIEHKRIIHLCMHVVGAGLAFTGSIIGIARLPRPARMTAHGAMGITAMILTFISLIGGCVHLFSVKQNFLPRHITRILHALCGCLTICCVFITYILGMQKVMSSNVFAMYIILAIVAVIGILVSPITTIIRKIVN